MKKSIQKLLKHLNKDNKSFEDYQIINRIIMTHKEFSIFNNMLKEPLKKIKYEVFIE